METIYDHNPTASELEAIGIDSVSLSIRHGVSIADPVTKNTYTAAVTTEDAYFDLALLFQHRNDQKTANAYSSKVPDRMQQYELGYDYSIVVE
jgi:hypothetical protein